eukprot:TRINITY_DN54420_c0_g1_i1.p1 TRINITY_DN54420_c0_g1~~TRINITY_DN54420_c0_g1_i1.p1  ORF type:complete len:216 (-),score=33.93 TRINITY_DN54420_c0_g1_i1:40-687(-)
MLSGFTSAAVRLQRRTSWARLISVASEAATAANPFGALPLSVRGGQCGFSCTGELPTLPSRPSFATSLLVVVVDTPRGSLLPKVLQLPTSSVSLGSPLQDPRLQIGIHAPAGSEINEHLEAPLPAARTPMECRYARRKRKSQGLEEKWWLEFDPAKANYISGFGRGPHGGNSIPKKDWPRQMVPIQYKKHWEKRERLRYAFRKNGFEVDVPKFGG